MNCLRCPQPAQPHGTYCLQCQRERVLEVLCWDSDEAETRIDRELRAIRGHGRQRTIRKGLA